MSHEGGGHHDMYVVRSLKNKARTEVMTTTERSLSEACELLMDDQCLKLNDLPVHLRDLLSTQHSGLISNLLEIYAVDLARSHA